MEPKSLSWFPPGLICWFERGRQGERRKDPAGKLKSQNEIKTGVQDSSGWKTPDKHGRSFIGAAEGLYPGKRARIKWKRSYKVKIYFEPYSFWTAFWWSAPTWTSRKKPKKYIQEKDNSNQRFYSFFFFQICHIVFTPQNYYAYQEMKPVEKNR